MTYEMSMGLIWGALIFHQIRIGMLAYRMRNSVFYEITFNGQTIRAGGQTVDEVHAMFEKMKCCTTEY
jgi:hypothetical protein